MRALSIDSRYRVVRNLADPASAQVFGPLAVVPGVGFDGDTWSRLTMTGISPPDSQTLRHSTDDSLLVDGATYMFGIEVANDQPSSVEVKADWCDVGSSATSVIVGPGQRIAIKNTGARASYDSTYRFFDLSLLTENGQILFRLPTVERRDDANAPLADGDSPNWRWDGTPGASTSRGRVFVP